MSLTSREKWIGGVLTILLLYTALHAVLFDFQNARFFHAIDQNLREYCLRVDFLRPLPISCLINKKVLDQKIKAG